MCKYQNNFESMKISKITCLSNFQVIIRYKKTVRFVSGPSQSKAGSETLANQFANCGCKTV